MGLIQIGLKAVAAAFFIWAGIFTYSIGVQRGAVEAELSAETGLLSPLKAGHLRDELLNAVQTDVAGDHLARIQALAKRAPVDPVPYEAALTRASSSFDPLGAEAFAARAKALQPRSLAARLHHLSLAAFAGEYEQVIGDYQRIIDLRAIDGNLLADALIGVFRSSGEWSALVAYIKTEPATGNRLLSRLMDEDVPVAELEGLIALYPNYQGRYLQRLVRDGLLEEAYSAWRLFANLPDELLVGVPFNSEFEDRTEPEPFNWSISRDRAEYQNRGGLYVTYLGTERPFIAAQTLRAAPGDYVLQTEAMGRMPEDGGALEWDLTCVESRTRIARQSLQLKTISAKERFEMEVTIPEADCAFQTLQLWGRAGAFPKTSRTEILSVQLIPAEE
ncbi:MAG: hypothetical protein AAFR51_05315 [Pseudomonadota bacterium]